MIWQCNSTFKDKTRCRTLHLTEDEAAERITFTLTCGMEIKV